MYTFATSPLRCARSLGHRFFLLFGLHCATHQIRVILISCVVITSLFYPALDVYTSSRTSSQSIIDAWLSPTSAPLTAEHDLVDLWSGQDGLHIHKDPVTRAKCNNGQALRVERLLIQSPLVEDDGALNHKILLSTYNLERRIQQLASVGESPCLRITGGQCLVISPLAFWDYDQNALGSDANIFDTLSYSRNISISGIPVTPHMVLAGRGSYGSYEPHVGGGNKFDYATYLVLTFFFPRNACWGPASEHSRWVNTIRNAVGDRGEVDTQMAEAILIALEHDPDRASITGLSVVSAFAYLAYIGFFAYVAWSVRRMDSIHSRLGITFTALVEIAVSTVTSLSVCALVGFKITMVPWEVLPIVIVFVGAENMFNLVDAVGKTSVTLSGKQRIAEGLSRGGTSNTLKVVSYNTILGVIAFFSGGAVRQFCSFAIVVLVAHWFLAHTFFMAVLSIDVARLELEELLRHDASLAPMIPSMPQKEDGTQSSKSRSGWQKLIVAVQQLLKGRAATNISLLMLLGFAATLYYTTYTTSTSPPSSSFQTLGAITRSQKTSPTWSRTISSSASAVPALSTPDHIWKTLNPARTPILYLRIEEPVKITFNRHVIPSSRASSTARTMRTFKFILWLLTIMIVPIAATTGALYGLLLYLLRNTELLEAQRNRLGTEDEDHAVISLHAKDGSRTMKTLEDKVKFRTLPRAFASDVELIASSKGGEVIISVGLHNEIVVWNMCLMDYVLKTDAGELLMGTLGAGLGNGVSLDMMASTPLAYPTVTCVAIDEDGKYCAVGTTTGMLTAWSLEEGVKYRDVGVLRPLSLSLSESPTSAVCELRFIGSKKKIVGSAKSPPLNGLGSEPSSPDSKWRKRKLKEDQKPVQLLATYANGMAAKWTIPTNRDGPTAVYVNSSSEAGVIRVLLPTLSNGQTFAGFCLDDGRLELVEAGQSQWTLFKPCILQVGNPADPVWTVHTCQTELGGIPRLVVVAATEAGVVSLWDGFTCECIAILDEPANGKVNQLRVSPVECKTCHFCGRLPMESLSVAFSMDQVVRIEKLYVDETSMATAMSTRRCSCSRASAHLQQGQGLRRVSSTETIIGRRSRSNSNTTPSQGGSPRMLRARLPTTFEAADGVATIASFPVSGHGVHSRRASEKESAPRRSSELLAVPPFHSNNIVANGDIGDSSAEVTKTTATPMSSGWSIWSSATVAPLTEISCERGGWDASGSVYVGIRRKSKLHLKSQNVVMEYSGNKDGLTSATLERWEMWCFDPGVATFRVSPLLSLAEPTETEGGSHNTPTPSPQPLSESPPNQKTFSFVSPRTPPSTFSRSFSTGPRGSVSRLPFTRVSPVMIRPLHAVAGFGNTVGVFQFTS